MLAAAPGRRKLGQGTDTITDGAVTVSASGAVLTAAGNTTVTVTNISVSDLTSDANATTTLTIQASSGSMARR